MPLLEDSLIPIVLYGKFHTWSQNSSLPDPALPLQVWSCQSSSHLLKCRHTKLYFILPITYHPFPCLTTTQLSSLGLPILSSRGPFLTCPPAPDKGHSGDPTKDNIASHPAPSQYLSYIIVGAESFLKRDTMMASIWSSC